MAPDTYSDLFWCYTAVWFCLAVYIGLLGVRVARLERGQTPLLGRSKEHGSAAVCNSKR